MSMLSNQRDTLLVMADALEDEYPSFAREVRRAADTIWELRNKLAGTVDQSEEIERLKEQIHWLEQGDILHVLTDQEYIDQWKHERLMQSNINALDDENAKLRELLEAILQCAGETKRDKGCDACPMFNGDEAGAYLNKNWCLLRPTMRELGIEVPHDN